MSDLVGVTTNGDIAIITINNPPVNALSPGVPEGIGDAIDQIAKDSSVKAAVLIGGGKTFIAGADIKEFAKMTSGKTDAVRGSSAASQIENSTKPVVVAILRYARKARIAVARLRFSCSTSLGNV